jgi:hypothetical protein
MVWLPQPVTGLSFIGLEMGEWVKFLPQVRSGEILPDRNLFYLPPITLGLMMAMWTTGWPNRRWQTWIFRALAVVVSLLAFPALEAIRFEPPDQWLLRLVMIGFVVVVVILSGFLGRLPARTAGLIQWSSMLILGLAGAVLPAWAFLAMRPGIAELFFTSVGFGPGFWLNSAGHLAIAVVSLIYLSSTFRAKNYSAPRAGPV